MIVWKYIQKYIQSNHIVGHSVRSSEANLIKQKMFLYYAHSEKHYFRVVLFIVNIERTVYKVYSQLAICWKKGTFSMFHRNFLWCDVTDDVLFTEKLSVNRLARKMYVVYFQTTITFLNTNIIIIFILSFYRWCIVLLWLFHHIFLILQCLLFNWPEQ